MEAPSGLSSVDAFTVLREDIKKAVYEVELSRQFYNRQKLLWEFSWHNFQTMLDLYGCFIIIGQIILIFLAFEYADAVWYESLIAEVVFLLFLFLGNVAFKLWDAKVKHNEIIERAKFLLRYLEDCSKVCKWDDKNYPNLYSPLSPSIVLQPTIRDGRLVNVPWALLVRGDCILLRPGQPAPARCRPCKDQNVGYEPKEYYELNEVFVPPTDRSSSEAIRECQPLQPLYCTLEDTPYIRNLKLILQKSLKRPTSSIEKERYLLFIMSMEHFGITAAVVFLYAINIVRYFYISQSIGTCSWIDLFLMQPVAATLPLTPILFPILWRVMNAGGLAWILALFYTARKQQFASDPFEEATVSPHPHRTLFAKYGLLKKYFMRTFKGEGPSPFRTQNLLHTLGRVTALCCLDKKGILSWPNPTAEKVFFLRTGKVDDDGERKKKHKSVSDMGTQVEVLDLTHDVSSPFRLQFDDQTWKTHVGSLKPLGLAILLNTCNAGTQEHYSQFCSHITCESIEDENSVPVINRSFTNEYLRRRFSVDEATATLPVRFQWCLCEVAFQIGFSREVRSSYSLESQSSTFRHLPQSSKEQRIANSLSMPKLKFPFPHMVAVAVKENYHEDHHLFTQGTGEIVADSCVDFWDGADLVPLTSIDRKKILDFYHRTSLTSYCTAFGYRPLDRPMSPELSKWYLEIPSECSAIYEKFRSPTPNSWDGLGRIVEENQSTDSAFGNLVDIHPVESVDEVFAVQSNQTFLGMVTMQYQAKIDMVQMIEQLDKACIRFVHFSKENELRSRVFSEKMGLESGWNCHISLLSGEEPEEDQLQEIYCSNGSALNRSADNVTVQRIPRNTSSLSAPSAINMEMSQVKFGDDVSVHSVDNSEDDKYQSKESLNKRATPHHRSMVSVRSTSSSSLLATSETNLSRSQSHITESTDQSAPNVPFDMQNRAKLPKGIKNIRPHIENVDNVPLLVSLFTDCTPEATEEMIQIMQDYGEIVCVIGSSANPQNVGAFMKGDASLAVEPLYPQLCQASPSFETPLPQNGPSPVEISRRLNSLPCALSFHRDELSSLLQLILESRHLISCFRNVMQFWTCCCCSITFMHIISALVMLPPILSSGQGLWLCFVVIPLLSISLIGLPTDPEILKVPTEKLPRNLSKELIGFIIWCYGGKFLPSMVIVVLLYALCTMGFCWDIVLKSRTLSANVTYEQCIYVYPLDKGHSAPDNWSQPELELAWFKAQHYACFFFVLYIIVISVSFVCRNKQLWQKGPVCNRLWVIMCTLVFALHFFYMSLTLYDLEHQNTMYKPGFSVIPVPIWLIAFLWPLVLIGMNEAIKRNEIRTKWRLQKRARLEFGTKLGMNSPF